jgi:hypothetical protein
MQHPRCLMTLLKSNGLFFQLIATLHAIAAALQLRHIFLHPL